MNLLNNIPFLLRLLALLRDWLTKPDGSARSKLYLTALSFLGTDASPNDIAPDEFGCAETVNAIHKKAFGVEIGGDVSTYRLYKALLNHSRFIGVDDPLLGDIVISPTGYGNGKLPNGHVGIVSAGRMIMSNSSSSNGLFIENFDLDSWKTKYVDVGGYPMRFFRRI